jgi:hypothetical protein
MNEKKKIKLKLMKQNLTVLIEIKYDEFFTFSYTHFSKAKLLFK